MAKGASLIRNLIPQCDLETWVKGHSR